MLSMKQMLLLETLESLNSYMRSDIYTDYNTLFRKTLPNFQTVARTEVLPYFFILVSDAKIAPDSYRSSNPIRQRYSIRQIIRGKRILKNMKTEYVCETSIKSETPATRLRLPFGAYELSFSIWTFM